MKYTVSLKGKQSVPPALRQGPERGFAHHGSVLPEKRPAGKPVGPDHGNQAGPRGGPEPSAPPAAEIYRLQEHRLSPGYDIVVVARVRAVYSRYAELERDFLRLAKKLQLLSPKVLMRRERSHEGCSALDDPVLPEGHLPCPSPPAAVSSPLARPMLWRPLKNTAPGRGAFLPCAGFSDAIPFTGRRALSMTPSPDPGQPVSPAGDRRRHPSNLEALQ